MPNFNIPFLTLEVEKEASICKFVHVIFDKFTGDVFCVYQNEDDCKRVFKEFFDGFLNADWCTINISAIMKNLLDIK